MDFLKLEIRMTKDPVKRVNVGHILVEDTSIYIRPKTLPRSYVFKRQNTSYIYIDISNSDSVLQFLFIDRDAFLKSFLC